MEIINKTGCLLSPIQFLLFRSFALCYVPRFELRQNMNGRKIINTEEKLFSVHNEWVIHAYEKHILPPSKTRTLTPWRRMVITKKYLPELDGNKRCPLMRPEMYSAYYLFLRKRLPLPGGYECKFPLSVGSSALRTYPIWKHLREQCY